jgi:hypothetical protein
VGLLNNAWAAVETGDEPIDVLMDTILACRGDGTRVVVESVTGCLDTLAERIVPEEARPRLARLTAELAGPIWERLGWESRGAEDDEARLTRAAAVWLMAVVAGESAVRREANRRVDAYLAESSSLEPTLAATLLRVGARLGTEARFDEYIARLRAARTPEDRDHLLMALADFPDCVLIERLLNFLSSDEVRGQDVWKPFRALLGNPLTQELTWEFVKARWLELREKAGPVGSGRVIQATRGLWRADWRADVAEFFSHPEHRVESAAKALDQTLEFMDVGIAFKAAQSEPLSRWLRSRFP